MALLEVPAPGTENDDRHLFDLSVGDDDILHFKAERYKVSLRFTVINLTNKETLYNFLPFHLQRTTSRREPKQSNSAST